MNRTSMKNILPQYFIVDREVLTDKHVIANRLNTFFTNIGPTLASQIVTDGNSSYEDFLINPTLHEFNFNQIGEEDVVNVIDKLPSKTSSGVDGISTNLLKDIKYIISKPLTLIINQCLETGIFPSKLKVAKVIPILKRGDETIFDNYRPISILPAISKVFERIIFNQIHNYFHVNDLYFCSQYGFRKEHSTELAVLELVDRITQHLDKGTTPINVYLDLSKAFDTLDHNILLHKLKYYGIEGTALRLFESYLNERQQYVDLDGTNSNYNRILTGVPQGSILGPLLFIIYINDIAQSSNHFNFIIYADDTTLCSTLKINADATQLNRELNNVSQWLNLNKLSLNVKKTKAMVFRMPQKKIIQPKIQINGSNIEFVENFIFLGITINNKLNWNSHINKVTNKISKTVGILNKLRSFLPSYVLQTIYNTLILPHLIYGILAWGRHTNAIHKIQKRAIRIIAASKYNAHTEPLFKQLNLLKACDICKLQELKFYHKLINGQLPKYFECFVYQTNLDLHNYNTRRSHRLHIPRINHAFAQLNIRHSVIQTVNNMPDNVIDKIRTHNLKGFSTYAKNYFISTYETTCEIANCYVCQQ